MISQRYDEDEGSLPDSPSPAADDIPSSFLPLHEEAEDNPPARHPARTRTDKAEKPKGLHSMKKPKPPRLSLPADKRQRKGGRGGGVRRGRSVGTVDTTDRDTEESEEKEEREDGEKEREDMEIPEEEEEEQEKGRDEEATPSRLRTRRAKQQQQHEGTGMPPAKRSKLTGVVEGEKAAGRGRQRRGKEPHRQDELSQHARLWFAVRSAVFGDGRGQGERKRERKR